MKIEGIIYIVLACTVAIILRRKFFVWQASRLWRTAFGLLYVASFLPLGYISTLMIKSNFTPPCQYDCRGESLGLAIFFLVFLSVLIFTPLWQSLFYIAIPSNRELSSHLSEADLQKWRKFKRLILILIFVTPVVAFILASIHPSPPPSLP